MTKPYAPAVRIRLAETFQALRARQGQARRLAGMWRSAIRQVLTVARQRKAAHAALPADATGSWSWALLSKEEAGGGAGPAAGPGRHLPPSISCSTCSTHTLASEKSDGLPLGDSAGIARAWTAWSYEGEGRLGHGHAAVGAARFALARERSAPCRLRRSAAARLEAVMEGCEHRLRELEECASASGLPPLCSSSASEGGPVHPVLQLASGAQVCVAEVVREGSFELFQRLEGLAADLLECSCRRDVPGAMEMFEEVSSQLDRVGGLLQQCSVPALRKQAL